MGRKVATSSSLVSLTPVSKEIIGSNWAKPCLRRTRSAVIKFTNQTQKIGETAQNKQKPRGGAIGRGPQTHVRTANPEDAFCSKSGTAQGLVQHQRMSQT